jgi:NADH-ubiquinone oxidoreductase chain 2
VYLSILKEILENKGTQNLNKNKNCVMLFISILLLIMVMAIPSLKTQISPILFQRLSSIILIYAGALSLNALYIQSIGSGIGIYSGLFHVTFISQVLDIFIFIIGAIILIARPSIVKTILARGYKIERIEESNYQNTIEYCIIVMFSTLGASLLISSADLISMYLSIELQSFGVYILSTLYRNSESATSAGLKYFLLGSLSSCLILLGSGLIYTFTGLTNFESIYSLLSVSNNNSIMQGLILGFIFIFVGLLFKISAAPLHNWSPDVYDDSPTIVTIWLTVMPKISILILLLEIYTHVGFFSDLGLNNNSGIEILDSLTRLNTDIISNVSNGSENIIIKNLLLISSLLSLIIGTIVGLAQSKIKRLLAYSTISHIGFLLLALAINTEQSIDSFLFYIIQYTITNLNTFLIILALGYIINNSVLFNKGSTVPVKDIRFISELKGQFFSNPLMTLSLTLCLLSMAGTPPLMGFFSKQFVLYSAIENGYYFMAILGILVSIISASYYLRIIRILYTDSKPTADIQITYIKNIMIPGQSNISNFHSLLISILTLIILLFVLKPSILLKSTQLLSLSLFYY